MQLSAQSVNLPTPPIGECLSFVKRLHGFAELASQRRCGVSVGDNLDIDANF
jgi:hypothetical protein